MNTLSLFLSKCVNQAIRVGTAPPTRQVVALCRWVTVAPAGDVMEIAGETGALSNCIDSRVDETNRAMTIRNRLLIHQGDEACPAWRCIARAACLAIA